MARQTTARDHPPEEAGEDTSFARGLRILLTVADRGEVRAEELAAADGHSFTELSLDEKDRYFDAAKEESR